MPCPSVGLVVEALREGTMCRPALLPACSLTDRGPNQRMAEPQHAVE
jgi:hypothetical protein